MASAARARRLGVLVAVAAGVVVTDQITKSLAVARLAKGPVHLVGPFSFQLTYNTGIAFSIGTGLTLPIVIVAVVLVGVVAWFARAVPTMTAAVAVGLVIGGAVGNLSDRLFRGHGGAVVDFIHSGFWPTFNVADASIVCGSALFALALWRAGSPERVHRDRHHPVADESPKSR